MNEAHKAWLSLCTRKGGEGSNCPTISYVFLANGRYFLWNWCLDNSLKIVGSSWCSFYLTCLLEGSNKIYVKSIASSSFDKDYNIGTPWVVKGCDNEGKLE